MKCNGFSATLLGTMGLLSIAHFYLHHREIVNIETMIQREKPFEWKVITVNTERKTFSQTDQRKITSESVQRKPPIERINISKETTTSTATTTTHVENTNVSTAFAIRNVKTNDDESNKDLWINILQIAGVQVNNETLSKLPTVDTLHSMYGKVDHPIVHGLETCEQYRETVPLQQRISSAAGLFNTGTNALKNAMMQNLISIKVPYQIPWGKHRTADKRFINVAPRLHGMNQSAVLPIVILRDPYSWMQSMCRHPYATKWLHRGRCPNLVPQPQDFQQFRLLPKHAATFNVTIIFNKTVDVQHWDSLVDLWSSWYRQYWEASFPRVMIRFEDLLLHSDDLMSILADCLGTKTKLQHRIQTASSKYHGSHTDFLAALVKTGNPSLRRKSLLPADLEYARKALDPELMQLFQYQYVEPQEDKLASPRP